MFSTWMFPSSLQTAPMRASVLSARAGRRIGLAGALLLAALPQFAAAQSGQVAGTSSTVSGGDAYRTAVASDVGVYAGSHALVIGINSYAGQWQPRASAISDANEVATSLKRLGFSVDKVLDPDRSKLDNAFARFLQGPGSASNARLVIWFSGQAVTEDGKGHLLSMSRQGDPGLFDLSGNSVSLDRISRYLRKARAKHVLSAFDACFSHSGFAMASGAPLQSLSSKTTEPVRQIITSCDANQVVSDSGKFRKLFLDALTGRAKVANLNKDAYLTGTELGLFLTDRLSSLTENLQTPTFGRLRFAGLDRGDTVFRIPSSPIRAAPVAPSRRPSNSQGSEPDYRGPEPRLVEKIQRRLSVLGCYVGPINGRWSVGTAQAVRQVNKRRRMNPPMVSAQPDQQTLDRLRDLSGQVCPAIARLPTKPPHAKPRRYKKPKSKKSTYKKKWTAAPKKKTRTYKKRKSKGKPGYDPQDVFRRMQEEGPG